MKCSMSTTNCLSFQIENNNNNNKMQVVATISANHVRKQPSRVI